MARTKGRHGERGALIEAAAFGQELVDASTEERRCDTVHWHREESLERKVAFEIVDGLAKVSAAEC